MHRGRIGLRQKCDGAVDSGFATDAARGIRSGQILLDGEDLVQASEQRMREIRVTKSQ